MEYLFLAAEEAELSQLQPWSHASVVPRPAPPRPGYTWRYTWYLFLSKAKKYPRTVTQPLASHVLSVVLSSCLLAQAAPGWGW